MTEIVEFEAVIQSYMDAMLADVDPRVRAAFDADAARTSEAWAKHKAWQERFRHTAIERGRQHGKSWEDLFRMACEVAQR